MQKGYNPGAGVGQGVFPGTARHANLRLGQPPASCRVPVPGGRVRQARDIAQRRAVESGTLSEHLLAHGRLALLLLTGQMQEAVNNAKEDPMPEFSSPFVVLKNDRKLTHEELVRAIRFMIAAEFEAIQLYVQAAESTDNRLAQEVLRDVANEEREHVGEFLRLLKELDPEEEGYYAEGEEEVEEMIGRLKKTATKKKR